MELKAQTFAVHQRWQTLEATLTQARRK